MSFPDISRCPPCPHTHKCVQGHGPVPSEYMGIGERPGRWENERGVVFIGNAGKELDTTYLPLAGLERSQLRIVNTVRCGANGNRKPSDKEIAACAGHHLPTEIEHGQPSVIFLLGATACKLVDGVDLDIQHGIPVQVPSLWDRVVGQVTFVPMYHPAAGMHRTSLMTPLLEDWEQVGKWLRGEWEAPTDNGQVCYLEIDSKYDFQCFEDARGYWQAHGALLGWVAVDTERHGMDPFSVQVCHTPHVAKLMRIRENNHKILKRLANWINEFEGIIVHQGMGKPGEPGDLDILESIGVKMSRLKVRDTMAEVYRLGNLAQGLKTLGYRLFGVRMRSWADVVTEPSKEKLYEWLGEAVAWAEANLTTVEIKQLKTKTKEIRKPSDVEKRLRAIWKYSCQSADYDPWEKLREDERVQLIIRLFEDEFELAYIGPPPTRGIAHVPAREMVHYACQDADMTMRLALWLDEERARLENVWDIPEKEWDAA